MQRSLVGSEMCIRDRYTLLFLCSFMNERLPSWHLTAVRHSVWQTGETALVVAIRLNKAAFIEQLINAGAKIEYENKVCGDIVVWTSAWACILFRFVETTFICMHTLLFLCSFMNERLPSWHLTAVRHSVWQTGETALMAAIRLNKAAFMEQLINAGAKIEYRNKVCSDTVVWTSAWAFILFRFVETAFLALPRTCTRSIKIHKLVLHRHVHKHAQIFTFHLYLCT